jgi:tetratricopeptide (TPR) repeat protein
MGDAALAPSSKRGAMARAIWQVFAGSELMAKTKGKKKKASKAGASAKPAASSKAPKRSRAAAAPPKLTVVEGQGGSEASDKRARAEAQAIVYQALEHRDPEMRARLAREALKVSEECADAWTLLAQETATSPEEALPMYQRALAVAERALGPDVFEEHVGAFWAVLETRPYMRARSSLAQALLDLGRRDEAREHMEELIELNPEDNLGVRDLLMGLLLEDHDDEGLAELLERYDEDASPTFEWTRVLADLRRREDPSISLERATDSNPHVPAYLLGQKPLPPEVPQWVEPGGETEAIVYAASFGDAWKDSPGALEWLAKATR